MIQQLDMASDLERGLWADACMAARVFAALVESRAHDKAGIVVKAHAGPVRDAWLAYLEALLPPRTALMQVPGNISVERLIGGLDLGLTLAQGEAVEMRGVLAGAHENILFLPTANRIDPDITALLAASMDSGEVRIERDGMSKVLPACFATVCFDDSEASDDALSPLLSDRMMLHIDLRPISVRAAQTAPADLPRALQGADIPPECLQQLCALPQAFGLTSMRPALQLCLLARTLCQLDCQTTVDEGHVSAAIRLSLVHRAKHLPAPEQDDAPSQPPPDQSSSEPSGGNAADREETANDNTLPDDMAMDAVAAALPSGLLAHLKASEAGVAKRASAGRRGARKTGAKRGRPLTSRKGTLSAGKRLDIIATLRAAAPYQKSRQQKALADRRGGAARVHVRAADFHIRRYQERSETSTIFVVDASGSTALNRLREAKGAVELLLGESYARRDYVSLVSFRGREAQTLLPPTRALVRAKRSLASLPGGGGTPLASGLKAALMLAQEERSHGRDPSIVIMTDGSANVDAQGNGGRKQAADDAHAMAQMIALTGVSVILVDIGRQPQKRAQQLARAMDATYLPMPFAQSGDLSAAIGAAR